MAKIRVCDICQARDKQLTECKKWWRIPGEFRHESFNIDVCPAHDREVKTFIEKKKLKRNAKSHEILSAWMEAGFASNGKKAAPMDPAEALATLMGADVTKGRKVQPPVAFHVASSNSGGTMKHRVLGEKQQFVWETTDEAAAKILKNALNDDPGIFGDRVKLAQEISMAQAVANAPAKPTKKAKAKPAPAPEEPVKEEPELEITEELLKGFENLLGELDPENLTGDGEITNRRHLLHRRDEIMKRWNRLEKQAGRRFGTDEMEQIVAGFRKETK